jgi:thiamine-monophosphate kinase
VPRLEEARWLAKRGAHAAIDISDGLLPDASHLARASGVTLSLDLDALPCMDGVAPTEAAVSGEEYELLVALPRAANVDARDFRERFGIPLTVIGHVVAAEQEPVHLDGVPVELPRGYDHLS